MVHPSNTTRVFKGQIIKKDTEISLNGEYPVSHLARELEEHIGEYAEVKIYIGKKK